MQVEFYFSPFNLPQDRHLQDIMGADGWVLLAEVCSWPRMALLGVSDPLDVARALVAFSHALEVDTSHKFIRLRSQPVYVLPDSLQSPCPPHAFHAMHPCSQPVSCIPDFQANSAQQQGYPHNIGVPFPPQYASSTEQFIVSANVRQPHFLPPGSFPMEASQDRVNTFMPHISMHPENSTITGNNGHLSCQHQEELDRASPQAMQPTRQPLSNIMSFSSESITEGETSPRRHGHGCPYVAECSLEKLGVEEGNTDPSAVTLQASHYLNEPVKRMHEALTIATPQMEAPRKPQSRPVPERPQQMIHPNENLCSKPTATRVPHRRVEQRSFADQDPSLRMPPTLGHHSSIRLDHFTAHRIETHGRQSGIEVHRSSQGHYCKRRGASIERVASDVSSDENSSTNRGHMNTSTAGVQLHTKAIQLRHEAKGRCRRSVETSVQTAPKVAYDISSWRTTQERFRSMDLDQSCNAKRKGPHRSRRWNRRDGHHDPRDRYRRAEAPKDRSPFCEADFPPLRQKAPPLQKETSAPRGCSAKGLKECTSRPYSPGVVWAKKPVSVGQNPSASHRNDTRAHQVTKGGGRRR